MNQILFLKDNDNIQEIEQEEYIYETKKKRKNFIKTTKATIPVLMVSFIVVAVGSLGMFALASNSTDKKMEISESNEQQVEVVVENIDVQNETAVDNILQENQIVENQIVENETTENESIENPSEEEQQQENSEGTTKANVTYKQDPSALAQINTKTRKTSNGKKYTSIGLINIPSLNIKYQILSKTSEELLNISVNKFWGPNPNEVGNLCIVGHNYKTSKFFGNLPKIKKGAKIYITDLQGRTVTYKAYETDVIKETDLECTSQQTNGNTEITLITCYYLKGYTHATRRFIVKARAI